MQIILASLFAALLSGQALAQDSDLQLPGEKWLAQFNQFVCSETAIASSAPAAMAELNVQFEQITTDATLDNVLLKASFEENGKTCRYSALLFADNAAKTVSIVESKAFALAADSDCVNGKAILDAAFAQNDYLYYGHPHNIAIMMPMTDAAEICGAGAEVIGANFVVKGRINSGN